MKNARRLLRKLDYLPRWAWYMLSLFIGGPIGPFVVYLVFHVLTKAADDEEAEQDSVDWGASRPQWTNLRRRGLVPSPTTRRSKTHGKRPSPPLPARAVKPSPPKTRADGQR